MEEPTEDLGAPSMVPSCDEAPPTVTSEKMEQSARKKEEDHNPKADCGPAKQFAGVWINGAEKNDCDEESPTNSLSSGSSDSELIKVQIGNLEMPIASGVLDDLMEESKESGVNMEVLLSKYMMEEVAKAIK